MTKGGIAIILRHAGKYGCRAVLFPPMARFHFARSNITALDPPRFVNVWEVKWENGKAAADFSEGKRSGSTPEGNVN